MELCSSKTTSPSFGCTVSLGKSHKIHTQTSLHTCECCFEWIQVNNKGSFFHLIVKSGITYPTKKRSQIQVSGKEFWNLPWVVNWGCSLVILWSSIEGTPERKTEVFHYSRNPEMRPINDRQSSTGARGKVSEKSQTETDTREWDDLVGKGK